MRFSTLGRLGLYGLLSAAVFSLVRGDADADADADFMSVRTSVAKDYTSQGAIPTEKYFHEASFHGHYDGRFANETLSDRQTISHLTALIQTYFSTMSTIAVETWLIHGSLLAWWWNQKIFPWDSDLDVQISEPTIHFLAQYYNMTEHHFDLPGVPGGRTYLLEVNPNYVVRSMADRLNVIDARWIDMSSGLFIDITAVRKDERRRTKGNPEALMCKDEHRYDASDIFPLRDSYFEGFPVKVPYAYTKLLEEEYGPRALTQTEFEGFRFNEYTKAWEVKGPRMKRRLRPGWRASNVFPRVSPQHPRVRINPL